MKQKARKKIYNDAHEGEKWPRKSDCVTLSVF